MKESNLKARILKTLGYVAEHRLALLTQDTDTAITAHTALQWCSKREFE
jgi:hypothetical protein